MLSADRNKTADAAYMTVTLRQLDTDNWVALDNLYLGYTDEPYLYGDPDSYLDTPASVSGEENKVKAELARSELELIDLLEKSGLESFDQLKSGESSEMNPEIAEILTYVIRELDEEGKIECDCPTDTEGDYEIEFLANSLRISCKCCKAEKEINVGSLMQAHALLEADKLTLESKT